MLFQIGTANFGLKSVIFVIFYCFMNPKYDTLTIKHFILSRISVQAFTE